MGARGAGGGDQLVGRSAGSGEADVGGDGVAEQEALLENHADVAAEFLHIERADVVAVDEHATGRGIVEAWDETQQGGFARAGFADDRHAFTRRDREVDALEH